MELLAETSLKGQAQVWQYMLGFADSMAVKWAVELRIADIINSHGRPLTLAEIAAAMSDASSPDIPCLTRIMRLLVRRDIFTAHPSSDDCNSSNSSTVYGLTDLSRWLLLDSKSNGQPSLAPMVLFHTDPRMISPWHSIGPCAKEDGTETAFKKTHGRDVFTLASECPEFNKLFNDAMACTSETILKAVLSEYRDGGFHGLQSLVDVGGGIGGSLSQIVKSHPHIKGINFDLPHVVATAPPYPGVSYVGGNMFESIPNADAVFIKWILHNWGDEDCVRILRNCRKAIPEKRGKLIIVDIVLDPKGTDLFDTTCLVLDLVMIALTKGGMERTEMEWKKILEEGGFPRYKIIKIPAITSIIEAYPE
ncbi:hypothetical protein TIFTF001_026236 [Ficus carica]|uniref:Uncharacterized protein n=1 Tax=Ficus carica TaxID=3494 RepID=A0AA88DL11_FICCA|nr:hypothetical protein TIFTF001_026236 [Ficus carica]